MEEINGDVLFVKTRISPKHLCVGLIEKADCWSQSKFDYMCSVNMK